MKGLHMQPIDIVYDICRYYISDSHDVDAALLAKIDGYRRSRNIAALSSCTCHFDSALHTIIEFRFLRQIEAFFKKNALFANSTTCKESAKESFLDSERQCSLTNRILKDMVWGLDLIDPCLKSQILSMVRYISNVLGDYNSFASELASLVKVTSGATATRSRRNSLPQYKMSLRPYVTPKAAHLLFSVYQSLGFEKVRFRYVCRNRVELVPKNWKTDRTIACEPEGNLALQLAFDVYAKRRLRLFGINLSDQSANQRLAKHASIHDDFVTVDFKNASNTICFNAISLVFPVEWFAYLDSVRTPAYRGVFGRGTYAMFSSMGNGATFCIETLIFAAACHAVGSRNFLVYGDDVIIEKEFYEAFIALTRLLGFTINQEKSYSSGPFRESCGGDYFNGVDVTPVYIRDVDTRKASLCHLINSTMSIALINGSLCKYLSCLVQKEKLPLVPYNQSTMSGIWIDPSIARRRGVLFRRNHRDFFKSYIPVSKKKNFVDSRGYYLWFLRKNSQVLFEQPWNSFRYNLARDDTTTETSSATVFDHAYVRKRVSWFPADGMPDHLYWWSEQLARK
jgi:hypothetical protein